MATSLTAESRSLCTVPPVSTQILTSTSYFQNIVFLGLIAAGHAHEIYANTANVVASELMCSAQGAEICGIYLLSSATSVPD